MNLQPRRQYEPSGGNRRRIVQGEGSGMVESIGYEFNGAERLWNVKMATTDRKCFNPQRPLIELKWRPCMIDPMVSLAFAVYSNKGAYALLLGSGLSRAFGIPTGWKVVLDLTRKVANLQGEECERSPANLFRNRHGGNLTTLSFLMKSRRHQRNARMTSMPTSAASWRIRAAHCSKRVPWPTTFISWLLILASVRRRRWCGRSKRDRRSG